MDQCDWILDGRKVRGEYLGTPVVGTVESSRVKYGGMVQYTVKLDEPIRLRWRAEPVTTVLLDEVEVDEVVDAVAK